MVAVRLISRENVRGRSPAFPSNAPIYGIAHFRGLSHNPG